MSADPFRPVAELHRDATFRAARRILGNDEDALDVTQDTLLKLAGRRHEITGPGVRAWLVRVATNGAIDRLRRRDPLRGAEPLDAAAPPAAPTPDRLESGELRERVRRALADLAPRQGEIIALRFFEGMPFGEAARAMGISGGAAKVHFRRGIEHLRDRLRPFGPGAPAPRPHDERSQR